MFATRTELAELGTHQECHAFVVDIPIDLYPFALQRVVLLGSGRATHISETGEHPWIDVALLDVNFRN